MADLKGRVAVVTGASRGVGRGIAEGLAEAGASVYVTGRSHSDAVPPAPGTLQATAERVEALGGKAFPMVVDHAEDEAVTALFRRIEAQSGRLDLLVNNACPPPAVTGGRRFWETPLTTWDAHLAVRLRGYYVAAALAARLMVVRGSGLIVNISCSTPQGTAYGMARAGVDHMAREMARELEGHGVAALALQPGRVRTESGAGAAPAAERRAGEEPLQSPRFVGRSVAALAMDPDIMEKTGGRYRVDELVREYRFSELGEENGPGACAAENPVSGK